MPSEFSLIPPVIVAVAIAAFLLVKDRDTLFKIDYSLLATFFAFFFFIFCGERRRDHSVSEFFNFDLGRPRELVAVLTSQITSNVPAALFCPALPHWGGGVSSSAELGGDLIASMASLISYKMVVKEFPDQRKRYFLVVYLVQHRPAFCFSLCVVLYGAFCRPAARCGLTRPQRTDHFASPAFCFRSCLRLAGGVR